MIACVSKAFMKDDGVEAAPVLRRRAPLPEGSPNYVTARGLQALRDELGRLDVLPGAKGLEARGAWRTELEQRLASAVVTPPPEHRDEIRFGATVRVRGPAGETRELKIVGVDEADAARGLVPFTAPFARAVLGRHVGDVVSVRTPRGEEELEVVAIEYDR
jgi:transcription elongation factor GreB